MQSTPSEGLPGLPQINHRKQVKLFNLSSYFKSEKEICENQCESVVKKVAFVSPLYLCDAIFFEKTRLF